MNVLLAGADSPLDAASVPALRIEIAACPDVDASRLPLVARSDKAPMSDSAREARFSCLAECVSVSREQGAFPPVLCWKQSREAAT